MRAFILISCFSVALARPEAGYAYNAPSHGGVGVGGFSSGIISGSHGVGLAGGHSSVGVGLGLGGSGSYSTVGHQGSGLAGGFGSGLSGGFVGGHGVGVGGGVGGGGSLLTAGVGDFGAGYASGFGGGSTATIQKHIYVHVPPPEPEDLRPRVVAPVAQPQKHYKIIFIKAPSAPSYNPQVIAPHVQHEEKTLIYVLARKPDEPQDIVVPTLPPTPPSKPEVYFIKYKTHKENIGGGLVGGGLVGGGLVGGVVGGAEGAGLGVGLGGSAPGVGIGHGVGSVAGLDAGIGGTTGHGVTGHGVTGAGVVGIGSSSSHSSGVHSAGVSISSSHSSEISHGSDIGTGIGLDVRGAGPTGTPAASYGPPGKSGPY